VIWRQIHQGGKLTGTDSISRPFMFSPEDVLSRYIYNQAERLEYPFRRVVSGSLEYRL
jgi:hypothetical protein